MKEYYKIQKAKLFQELDSSRSGLSEEEAVKRLNIYGLNKLTEKKPKPWILVFLNQFADLMVVLLILASIFSAVVSYVQHESYIDSIIIIIIVIINAILSFIQERKADTAVKELNKMFVTKTYVIRDNQKQLIDVIDIVPGDIIELEAGDYISADSRIIESSNLEVNESTLTGESRGVKKNELDISDSKELYQQSNMVFAGCNVLNGHAFVIACTTGMNTELGKIASSLVNKKAELTPLQVKINKLSKTLTYMVILIIFVMMIIGLLMKQDFFDVLMLSISLAVAAIPEGLSSVITIILSLGMTSLAKKNVIIRKMASVETLGSTDVICSDKTGTITQNKMTVKYLYENMNGIETLQSNDMLIKCASICSNVVKNGEKYIGDETEIAVYKYLEEQNVLFNKFDRVKEKPFDSERKMMSVQATIDNKKTTFTKGSVDSIIANSKYYLLNNNVYELTNNIKKEILNEAEKNSLESLRVLAYAYNENKFAESDMVFIGLIGMMDPPRESVSLAISKCISSGIKPIMITGDSLQTAIAIAKSVGIISNENLAIEGKEIDSLGEEELAIAVNKYQVYARVSPSTKYKIVSTLKKQGHIVAMTGDGVNDAPAIQEANIGIGMGITGTEVVKKVADCILIDDSFSTIVDGVEEGRRITTNIKKVILYLLAGNIIEVILVFMSLILNMEMFTTIQLLWINLVTDSIPAIMLAYEKAEDEIKGKGNFNTDSFLTPFIKGKIIIGAIIKSIIMLILFLYFSKTINNNAAGSLMFIFLITHELLFSISCKNPQKSILNLHIFDNVHLNIGLLGLLILQLIITFTGLSKFFITSNLGYQNILITIGICILIFIIGELVKPIYVAIFNDGGSNERK